MLARPRRMRGLVAAVTAASLVLLVAAATSNTSVGAEGALFGVGGGDAGSDALVAAASSDEAYQVSIATSCALMGPGSDSDVASRALLASSGIPGPASDPRSSHGIPRAIVWHNACRTAPPQSWHATEWCRCLRTAAPACISLAV